jgi:hypothetical protein
MSPAAVILDVAILVAIIGIVVYWVRRFAVFRGYKDIGPAVQQLASALKAQAVRENNDVVVAGHFQGHPAILRFSRAMHAPALSIELRAPVTCDLLLVPPGADTKDGRVVMRSGSADLDRKFDARTDTPAEARMFLAEKEVLADLGQLCCSRHTRLSMTAHSIRLSELTVPDSTASHVIDHLDAMARIADRLEAMPGADQIKIEPFPRRGSSWTIRVTLAAGLVGLVILLFAQPYNRPSNGQGPKRAPSGTGIPAADAARMQKLEGWRVAGADDFSGLSQWFLRQHGLPVTGRVIADFGGRSVPGDSAYLLINDAGRRRLVMLAGGAVVYDVIFPHADLITPISHRNLQAIEWNAAPQFAADGDALLVIQNAEDPTQSVVLLRHGTQTYSARPADFNKIEFAK